MDYINDTIESKLEKYDGKNVIEFLEQQVDYFIEKVLYSEGAEREHYGIQLKITSRAIQLAESN